MGGQPFDAVLVANWLSHGVAPRPDIALGDVRGCVISQLLQLIFRHGNFDLAPIFPGIKPTFQGTAFPC